MSAAETMTGAAPAGGPMKDGRSGMSGGRPGSSGLPVSFCELLGRIADRHDLSRQEAAAALDQIVDGVVGEAEAAAFLMGLRVKGETAMEIAGLVDAMRCHAVRVEAADPAQLVDIVGTGGDCLGTFNISTTAAFVVAGAGVRVAKHGNRAASSRCGSADVLEALGVRIDLGPAEVATCIDRVGMGFMLAAIYHPAAGRVAPVRRALAVRTVFNFLGPLTNPAGAGRQLMGVSSEAYLDVLAGALAGGGSTRALLVHGKDGMDELSVTGATVLLEVKDGVVQRPYEVGPEDLGLTRWKVADLLGGDPQLNGALSREVLSGAGGARRDAVLANAAAGLYVAEAVDSLRAGVDLARQSIDSGRARKVLDDLVGFTNSPSAVQS